MCARTRIVPSSFFQLQATAVASPLKLASTPTKTSAPSGISSSERQAAQRAGVIQTSSACVHWFRCRRRKADSDVPGELRWRRRSRRSTQLAGLAARQVASSSSSAVSGAAYHQRSTPFSSSRPTVSPRVGALERELGERGFDQAPEQARPV